MGHPFFGKQFTFRQPDQSEIQVIGWGDDIYAIFEDTNGYTVYLEPESRNYTYAIIDPETLLFCSSGLIVGSDDPAAAGLDRHIRESTAVVARKRSQKESAQGQSEWRKRSAGSSSSGLLRTMEFLKKGYRGRSAYVSGTIIGLCIPVDFRDDKTVISQQEIEAFCNKPGYSQFGNNGSVRDYFYDVSGGQLDYRNLVTPVYRAKHKKTYYTESMLGGNSRAVELIKEALDYYCDKQFDFSSLTVSPSGAIYALNVFYAGSIDNAYAEGLWPHQWFLESPIDLGFGFVKDYQITNMGTELALGTFCHESGHLICGFPDLYDTDLDSAGVGVFCLMGLGGTWDKFNPVEPCAFLKYRAGWFGPVFSIEHDQDYFLTANKNAMAFYMRNNSEYLIFEHRSATARDRSLPCSGLAIWHIDVAMDNNNLQYGDPNSHYLCALLQADGQFHLERNTNSGDSRDLFGVDHLTEFPSAVFGGISTWWDASPTGLTLSNIRSDDKRTSFSVGSRTE